MNNITKEVGRRIRYYRKRKNLSQEKLAELCNLHPTYIGQVERGEKNASLESICRISEGLGVSLERLFEHLSREEEREDIPWRAYNMMLELDEQEQKELWDIIERILNLKGRHR